ncbi:MAG: LysM peptidoglycan-binding domain-containing protein [Verrucomicrobia bacterium]|nr:LysM peptidoglycan-binding domain-containing protein [Verrucomicrobiota bacterium]
MRLGILFLFLGLIPLAAQNAQIAGMQQDLAELRNEVEKLKLENADLRTALNRQKAGQSPAASQGEALSKARAETLVEVDRRLKQQTDEVNAALAELTRQVNAALGKSGPAPATKAGKSAKPAAAQTETPATTEAGAPSDVPQTGIKYHVKSGDTVTKIALRNGSKAEWILKANNLSSPAALKADVDIFVPQPEAAGR